MQLTQSTPMYSAETDTTMATLVEWSYGQFKVNTAPSHPAYNHEIASKVGDIYRDPNDEIYKPTNIFLALLPLFMEWHGIADDEPCELLEGADRTPISDDLSQTGVRNAIVRWGTTTYGLWRRNMSNDWTLCDNDRKAPNCTAK